jgi:hypothetical protein
VTRRREHPDWCTGGHRCGLGEHRGDPITVSVLGVGGAVLTRVRAADGTEHAEVWLRVELPGDERGARRQLYALLAGLRVLLGGGRRTVRRSA